MKIQLKRSNVLDGTSAKPPLAGQLEYGELAVNYNSGDPVIFLKDSTDAIIRIAGSGAEGTFDGDYNNLENKPTIGDGKVTLTYGGEDLTDGEFTVNQEGDTVIDIPREIPTTVPGSPSNNDLWLDTSECPPELKIWTDCDDPGNPEWITIGGGAPPRSTNYV